MRLKLLTVITNWKGQPLKLYYHQDIDATKHKAKYVWGRVTLNVVYLFLFKKQTPIQSIDLGILFVGIIFDQDKKMWLPQLTGKIFAKIEKQLGFAILHQPKPRVLPRCRQLVRKRKRKSKPGKIYQRLLQSKAKQFWYQLPWYQQL